MAIDSAFNVFKIVHRKVERNENIFPEARCPRKETVQ